MGGLQVVISSVPGFSSALLRVSCTGVAYLSCPAACGIGSSSARFQPWATASGTCATGRCTLLVKLSYCFAAGFLQLALPWLLNATDCDMVPSALIARSCVAGTTNTVTHLI
jgi:hypothetical protein